MNSNKTIVASFAKITYSLQFEVQPSGAGTIEPNSGTYEGGTQISVVATPASGYRFDHWGGSASGTSNSISILMNSDKNITAYFTKVYSLNVEVNPEGSGSVNPGTGLYDAGTKVSVTAVAMFPYVFTGWLDADNEQLNPRTVTLNADKSLIAHFTKLNPGAVQTSSGIYTGREIRLPITLRVGQWVQGGFISDSLVNVPLRILDPAFGVVKDLGYTLNVSFTFQAQVTGDYYINIPYTFAFSTSNYTITYTIYS